MVRVRKRQIEFREGEVVSFPQVIGSSRMDFERFVQAMSDGGQVATTEVMANFARLQRALTRALADGNRVETPIGTFSVSLGAGERDDAGGFYITGRNARVNFRPARQLIDAVRAGITFDEETEVTVRRPILDRLENSVSGVMLKTIYPTELVYLIGKNLEFDHENEQEGVFFVGAKGKETRATSYGRGNAGQLSVVVPTLASGAWTVQVRATRDEMGLQAGTLAGEVTVEPAPTTGSGE
jgi:hypothetical protein